MDDDSAAFTKEWESVSTPSREVTILAASILIVTAIPSAGPFSCLDEKKLQRTFKLYLVSNSNKRFLNLELLADLAGMISASHWSRKISRVFRKISFDFFE